MFGVNVAYRACDLDYLVTVNDEFWTHYFARDDELRATSELITCFHHHVDTCRKYGLRHFDWFDDDDDAGLSNDPARVHLGHSSGFAALNIASLMGCNPIYLLGHDLRYPPGYDGRRHVTGGLRHSAELLPSGEYAAAIQHWPSVSVRKTGELDGLIRCYDAVARQKDRPTIINLTPGSALECFPAMRLSEACDAIRRSVRATRS